MDTSEFPLEGPSMVKSKSKWGNRYTPEFKQQMVELVRAGRAPNLLSAHRRGDFRVISARLVTAIRVR